MAEIDADDLRRLSEAATPGPWLLDEDGEICFDKGLPTPVWGSDTAEAAFIVAMENAYRAGTLAHVPAPGAERAEIDDLAEEIEVAVEKVIAANPDKAQQAQGKPSLAGWFVGQVMRATNGKPLPMAVLVAVRARLRAEHRPAVTEVTGALAALKEIVEMEDWWSDPSSDLYPVRFQVEAALSPPRPDPARLDDAGKR